ncbi:hypothetical protein EBR77_00735 [bacterium]|nr:hypothetical protein [bacterium]NBX78599.1 hypothetical protein [bacterium]
MVLKKIMYISMVWFVSSHTFFKVYVTPVHDIRSVLIDLIEHEQVAIHSAQFLITDMLVVTALQRAIERGVHVDMVVDQGVFGKYGKGKELEKIGVHITIFEPTSGGMYPPIMHNKMWVFEQNDSLGSVHSVAVTGSYNPTVNAAKHNFENIAVFDDADAVNQYRMAIEQLHSLIAGRVVDTLWEEEQEHFEA